jgi:hypothetical protein
MAAITIRDSFSSILGELRGSNKEYPLTDRVIDLTHWAGCFADGYTPEDITQVSQSISLELGVYLVCLWDERVNDDKYQGDSELFLLDGMSMLAPLPNNIFDVLFMRPDFNRSYIIDAPSCPTSLGGIQIIINHNYLASDFS